MNQNSRNAIRVDDKNSVIIFCLLLGKCFQSNIEYPSVKYAFSEVSNIVGNNNVKFQVTLSLNKRVSNPKYARNIPNIQTTENRTKPIILK